MSNNLIYFTDITKDEWNEYVQQMPDAGYNQSWYWINYISKYPNIKKNLSFILEGDNNSLLAICPLAITYNDKNNYFEISFGGNPCGTPLIANVRPNLRRKILDEIFNIILSLVQKFDIKKINMVWDPLINSFCTESSFHKNYFELLRYQMNYYVENVIVINLDLPEEVLFENVSKYQQRHIKRSEKKGIIVKAYNNNFNSIDIEKYFSLLQDAHFKSAGRMTRPQETWEAMLAGLLAGEATLFVAHLENEPISYLYCGEFNHMSFGWSQVNYKEYESEYSLRHILEWKAMIYYKEQKFKYYEVGERYYGSQIFHIPTEKEISISVLKERFGGLMLPKIRWTGYFDHRLCTDECKKQMEEFLAEMPIIKIP